MSQRNGDKSRFHRLRKQKIARRSKVRELRQSIQHAKPAKAKDA